MTHTQITIQNISENIMHIISLLDQNARTMPSPEIVKKMMLSQSLPKKIMDWACTAKTFLAAKLKNLMTVII